MSNDIAAHQAPTQHNEHFTSAPTSPQPGKADSRVDSPNNFYDRPMPYQRPSAQSASKDVPSTSNSQDSGTVPIKGPPPANVSRHYSIRAALGLHAETPIQRDHVEHAHHDLWWSRVRLVMREPFAEFWGTFVMILFGDGSVAQVLLSQTLKGAPGADGFGAYQSISWAWGIGVSLGVIIAGDSGGFLNPAITLGFCVYRGLPFRRFLIYFVAQFLGAFLASGVVYANYIPAINSYAGEGVRTVPPEKTSTAQIFCTYPQAFLTKGQQFTSEFITASILMFCIFGLKDASNPGAMSIHISQELFPLFLFLLIFGLGACWGFETGYAINLVRDFGPRLMSYIVGYGPEVWTAGNYYFWVPMVASFVGCMFGGFLYDLFIYTGPESPINSPWFGIPYIVNPARWIAERRSERENERYVEDEERNDDIGKAA